MYTCVLTIKVMITIILLLNDMWLHIMKDLGNLSSEDIFWHQLTNEPSEVWLMIISEEQIP